MGETRKILVPVGKVPSVSSISGNTFIRFDTKLTAPGRPLRLLVPQYLADNFVVGGFGVVRGGGELELGPAWSDGHTVPALVYSEAFRELDFELDMPLLRAGDIVSFAATNINPCARWFSAGWLVELMEPGNPGRSGSRG